ncbi:MAG: carbamoyltransferase HypF, partial [Planctomycetales bacterium]|nr:carbamoyltransferase HypF [Planctomycetales bacterium]
MTTQRIRILVQGIVQGVGFRPFVHRVATRQGLVGFVQNEQWAVRIELQGDRASIDQSVERLVKELPVTARIDTCQAEWIQPVASDVGFQIVESAPRPYGPKRFTPDSAMCLDCVREFSDPADRRYRYPFMTCAVCGPRFTILESMPFDRLNTSMVDFPMCERCRREYADPCDRRFHAQTMSCPDCGPSLWFAADVKTCEFRPTGQRPEVALAAFRRAIADDRIVAVKGIGGFHLACRADSQLAVQRLRERKERGDKPFAVMVRDVAEAETLAFVGEAERVTLQSAAAPIVLLTRRANIQLATAVAPDNPRIGIMLPYSPLHRLLVEAGPLVMTSGNVSGEPLAYRNEEAAARLGQLADAYLLHNRRIVAPSDDSVTLISQAGEVPVRRARGTAPRTLEVPGLVTPGLAVGGELKGTICVFADEHAYVSQHLGDWEYVSSIAAADRTTRDLLRLTGITPQVIACDLHPDYHSTRYAEATAQQLEIPLVRVQHHHAHLAALLAEHNCQTRQEIIGFSFDGTGYGDDGAIWGSEVLIASMGAYRRVGHLDYFPLPGGDAAAKQPWRVALAALWAVGLPWDERLPCVRHRQPMELRILRSQLERQINSPATSSMGRLFDAVSSLVGLRQVCSYEAQAAMELEGLVDVLTLGDSYRFEVDWQHGGK